MELGFRQALLQIGKPLLQSLHSLLGGTDVQAAAAVSSTTALAASASR